MRTMCAEISWLSMPSSGDAIGQPASVSLRGMHPLHTAARYRRRVSAAKAAFHLPRKWQRTAQVAPVPMAWHSSGEWGCHVLRRRRMRPRVG
jgi:hypothetical protein